MATAGRMIRVSKNPPQPWVGSMSSFKAKISNRVGAVRNTGIDCPSRVKTTADMSQAVPCFRAANKPMGIPRPTDIIRAAMFNWAETHIFFLSSSATLRPRYLKLSPKSPRVTLRRYRPYWTMTLSFRPRCSRMRSTTLGSECCPSRISTGSPGPKRPSMKVIKDMISRITGSQIRRRAMYFPTLSLFSVSA